MLQVIQLQQSDIDQAIENAQGHEDVINAIFALLYPGIWDRITRMRGYPICNEETWKYICKQCQCFDRKHYPDVMPGGRWMNSGFSTTGSDGLAYMEVKQAPYEINGELFKDEEVAC